MDFIAKEVRRVLDTKRLAAAECESEVGQRVVRQALSRYGGSWPLWNQPGGMSVHDSNAWRWIEVFLGNDPAYMFFDPTESRAVFVVGSGAVLTQLLGETPGFEFYVTDESTTFLLCFNHHDVLAAWGRAEEWLASIDSGQVAKS